VRVNPKVDTNEYGIKFDYINFEDRTSIEAFIQSKLGHQSELEIPRCF
jgi:hypothetical protein